jgi:hypothetical protein
MSATTFMISIAGGKIDVDSKGEKGGNLRAASLHKVIWDGDNRSVRDFDLKFEELVEGEDGVLVGREAWPFTDVHTVPPDPELISEEQGAVMTIQKFQARLADEGIYKYTITARNRAGATFVLDPMIIVGKGK